MTYVILRHVVNRYIFFEGRVQPVLFQYCISKLTNHPSPLGHIKGEIKNEHKKNNNHINHRCNRSRIGGISIRIPIHTHDNEHGHTAYTLRNRPDN